MAHFAVLTPALQEDYVSESSTSCETVKWSDLSLSLLHQLEYERQVASLKAANAAENDFSVSQAEMTSRQAMLENASDIKVPRSYFGLRSLALLL